jgi:hypothetical protein
MFSGDARLPSRASLPKILLHLEDKTDGGGGSSIRGDHQIGSGLHLPSSAGILTLETPWRIDAHGHPHLPTSDFAASRIVVKASRQVM